MAKQKTKEIIVGTSLAVGVGAFALFYLDVLGTGTGSPKSTNSLNVPSGYAHESTQQQGSETVHNFKKAPPREAVPVQDSELVYQRYLDGLPTKLDQVIGQEFRTLSVSLQNAQLYADTTGLIRQGKENLKTLNELETSRKEEVKKHELQQGSGALVVDYNAGKSGSDVVPDQRDKGRSELDKLDLEGVVGGEAGEYAIFIDGLGRFHEPVEGAAFGNGFVLESLTQNKAVVSEGEQQRIFTVM